ncbi:hypothetical protein N836_13615 [Leptolyngbya sp. Heron Island J]|uniref:hypothetical protein n=1 Tax=Leptolyngbya sp. Heron Island J TaxID=1385935 RepID=UPI0003B964D7|nr:hypothetical protein [Leptolyngbya sp. Heron Island J]ESA35098.1 hypothetical protein N836_13615 [Leptolyngbya sp. Heron Island J]
MQIDNDILEQIQLGNEAERDQIARQILAETEQFLADTRGNQQDTEQRVNSLFKAADYAPDDPFTPPDTIPGYDEATYQALKQQAVEQSRALEVGELVAKNYIVTERIEGHYADAALIQAQTQVKYQNIANEGLKLQQAIQVGELITAKTEGILIETQTQGVKNLTARKLLEIEAERGNALIEGAALEVQGIRAANNSRLIASSNDFDSLKSAAPTVSV